MEAVGLDLVHRAIRAAAPAWDHPINDILQDGALEDAAVGGFSVSRDCCVGGACSAFSAFDLQKARASAESAGRLGEALVNAFLRDRKQKGEIAEFAWASDDNAVSPYDFNIDLPDEPRS